MTKLPANKTFSFFILAFALSLFILVLIVLLNSSPSTSSTKDSVSASSRGLKELSENIKTAKTDPSLVAAVTKKLSEIPKEQDEKNQYKSLSRIAAAVGLEYNSTHNPKLRTFLEALKKYVSKNYADIYKDKKSEFYVNCIDEICGKLDYPPEIQTIKEKIEKTNLGLNKKSMLIALYDAAILKPDDQKRIIYFGIALQLLEREAGKDNKEAKTLVSDLTNFLQKTYGDSYQKQLALYKIP